MSKILYFEYLLSSMDLASRIRELKLSEAQIGYSAGDNLDWKEDAAWEQAQRDFMVAGQRLAETRGYHGRFRDIIKPNTAPRVLTVQVGTGVLFDVNRDKERFLIGGTSEIDEDSGDKYHGRISIDASLGKVLNGKSKGDRFDFIGSNYEILSVKWGVPSYLKWYLPRYFDSSVARFKKMKDDTLERGILSSTSLRMMNLADRFRFLEMVTSAYHLNISFREPPIRYEKGIVMRLSEANLYYIPFSKLVRID